ncbi:hypothetical protein OAG68_02180 [bacterium]|nr:hypothetical protein [bacterium]
MARYPIAKSGSSYFLVVNGGRGGAGQTTDVSKYIDHCHQSGAFLEESIPVPTAGEAAADANQLRNSERWVAEFMNSGDGNTWKSIQSQIPNRARELTRSKE